MHDIRRDFGATWRERLAEARERAADGGPELSPGHVAELRRTVAELDVSSPENMALLWSGRAILTAEPLDTNDPNGKRWWDELAPRDAQVFSKLHLSCRLEDTPAGQFLTDARLNYAEGDPLSSIARELWETVSARFVAAASGRIEIIAEGAFGDGVFRAVELRAVLSNEKITAINGLDRGLFPSDAGEAFALLRRWGVERSRRYHEFIAANVDATAHERESALDDYREIQLWYEQDFPERLGRQREHPALPEDVAEAPDRSMAANAWKYSAQWRAFIRSE